jgi:predicted negative regulator of RcsB-dependent stress response
MSYNLEEQDQLAQLRDFWERWGTLLTLLLAAALLGVAGMRGWQWWQQREAVKASALYVQIGQRLGAGDLSGARAVYGELQHDFAASVYAPMGALELAKASAVRGDTEQARTLLQWTATHAKDTAYRAAALLALSAMRLDAKQYDAALASVRASPDPAFDGLFSARRGDILALQGKRDAARQAYTQALQQLSPGDGYRGMVERSLEAVGGRS